MSSRRLAAALLGAWLAGMAFMTLVAIFNLRAADDVVARPPSAAAAAEAIRALGQPQAKALLRHYGSELSRSYFTAWEWAQLPLGGAVIAALYRAGRGWRWPAIVCCVLLSFVLVQRLALTPRLVELSRTVEMAPTDGFSAGRAHFWNNHRLYASVETVKAAGLLVVLVHLLRRTRRTA
jgi:hypothetical protein